MRFSLVNFSYKAFNIFKLKGDDCTTEVAESSCHECNAAGTDIPSFNDITVTPANATSTTTPSPSLCWQNGKNPCSHGGCTINNLVSPPTYLCSCIQGYSGI